MCLGVVTSSIVILMTGWPQRALVEYAARRALGAGLDIEGLAVLGSAARADRVRLYDLSAAPSAAPLVEAKGVALRYGALLLGPRRLARLDIDALNIHLDGRDPVRTNFSFLTNLLARPKPQSKRDVTEFLPETVAVTSVFLRVESPTMDVSVGGYGMSAAIRGARDMDLKAEGSNLKGEWRVAGQNAAGTFDDGRVNALLEIKEGHYRTNPSEVLLPGFLEVQGSVDVRGATSETPAEMGIRLDRFVLEGADLSHANWSFLPFPLKFGHIDMSDSRVRLVQTPDGLALADAGLALSAKDVALGPDGMEWFTGDFSVSGQSNQGEHDFTVTFGQGQTVAIQGTGAVHDGHARVTVDAWSRDQIDHIVTKAFPAVLQWAPMLRGLSGIAEVSWQRPDYTLDVQLTPLFGESGKGEVHAKGHGAAVDTGLTFNGAVSASWAGGTMDGTLDVSSRDQFALAAKLDNVDLRAWLPLAPPLPLPETMRGVVSGKAAITGESRLAVDTELQVSRLGVRGDIEAHVKASASSPSTKGLRPLSAAGTIYFPTTRGSAKVAVTLPEGRGYDVQADLDKLDLTAVIGTVSTTTSFDASRSKLDGKVRLASTDTGSHGSVDLSVAPSPWPQFFASTETPVRVRTQWKAAPAYDEFVGDSLNLDLGDNASIALTKWRLQRKGMALQGTLAGRIAVARLAPLQGLSDLKGVVALSALLEYRDDTIVMDFTAQGEELGYGIYAAPPGVPVVATGRLNYEIAKRKGRVEKPVLAWTDSTKVVLETMNFTTTPELAPTSFTLATDLTPLVLWGIVEEAEGSATVKGTVRYEDHAPKIDAAFDVVAPTVILPGKLAVLGGVASDGRLGHADGLTAKGRVGAATLTAAGALLQDLRGPFTYERLRLTSKGLTGTLWDGRLTAEVDANLAEATRPVHVQAKVEDLDLDTFTKEYKPPRTRLTGRGNGTVSFTWSKEGFRDLDADLKSSHGFSVNRDIVYQLLMSQYVKEAKGGKKLDQIVSEVIGKGEQRPFDSGQLALEMGDGERIEGDAWLKSKALNLTIDIRMDPEALAQLLELRQEANLDKNISGIRTDPIELRD